MHIDEEEKDSSVMDKMPLEDFMVILHRDLYRFKNFWMEGQRSNKDNFPEILTEDEWSDQYILFITG